jgi:hypothetical protein
MGAGCGFGGIIRLALPLSLPFTTTNPQHKETIMSDVQSVAVGEPLVETVDVTPTQRFVPYSPKQTAKLLGTSTKAIYDGIARGDLGFTVLKVGGQYRILIPAEIVGIEQTKELKADGANI